MPVGITLVMSTVLGLAWRLLADRLLDTSRWLAIGLDLRIGGEFVNLFRSTKS